MRRGQGGAPREEAATSTGAKALRAANGEYDEERVRQERAKDTFVTTALQAGTKIAWPENQTGVNYETLPKQREEGVQIGPQNTWTGGQSLQGRDLARARKCEEGDLNPKKGSKS